MLAAFAKAHFEVEVERAARAEEERRPPGGEARAVGGDQHIGRERRFLLLTQELQARRADLLAGLDQHLEVEAEAAARAQHRLERCQVDRVLALVVGGAAAVDAAAFAPELPGLETRAPFALLAADHVAMAVGEHRRRRLFLNALGDEERAVLAGRIGQDPALEAHALQALGELGLEVFGKRGGALGVLAFRGDGDAALEVLEEAAFVEVALGGVDGLRTAHAGSIASRYG